MKRKPDDQDRGPGDKSQDLREFFEDYLRVSVAEAPTFEELAAYVEGRLDRETGLLLEERMAEDAALRQEVEDLRALHAQMARPRRAAALPLRWRLGALAAAAAAALVFWLLRPPADVKTPEGPAAPPAPAVIAALRDGDRRLALSADGGVAGVASLDPAMRATVAAALRGVLPVPQGLEPLAGGQGRLMGESTGAPSFAPVSPLGTRSLSDRPMFRWAAHPGARAYEVAVFDTDLRKQQASGPVAATEWQPPQPLPRGRTYVWQVTALAGGERVTAPAPPAPEARFEVMGPAVLSEVESRRAQAPGSHLVAAIALVEAGALDEADAELRALAADNPGSPEAARLQDALKRLRR